MKIDKAKKLLSQQKFTVSEIAYALGFSSVYYFIRAAYVEGKIGYETSASMYHKSSLDGYFYSYYENKKSLLHDAYVLQSLDIRIIINISFLGIRMNERQKKEKLFVSFISDKWR